MTTPSETTSVEQGRGDFIAGRFVVPSQDVTTLRSHDPAHDGAPVLEAATSRAHIELACETATQMWPRWMRLSLDARMEHLSRFREALRARSGRLADAIVREVGKIRSEAEGEVRALISRFDGVYRQIRRDLAGGPLPGHPGESLRYHPHGVVGVIGPFNYPLHLCHAHAIPALLLGNAVVIKPSETTLLSAQCYAEAAADADLPTGVLNIVQGDGKSGAALVENPRVRGLCFTGSWHVGHRIQRAALERPELLLALEMGGRNTAVVLDDADIRQAAHEIVVGGYLTTGQRCTCTNRVLVQRSVRDRLVDALRDIVESLRFGDPEDPSSFAGPLASESALERYDIQIRTGERRGAEPVVPHERLEGGYFVTPSLHLVPEDRQEIAGYTDDEVFGPNLAVETVEDDRHAINQLRLSPYGLANAVFTASRARFEHLYECSHAGVWNLNRTTNKASPRLPFGGVGRSGNQRPAGAFAPRNVIYPVAVQQNVQGGVDLHPKLLGHLPAPDLDALEARHAGEEACEAARNPVEAERPLAIGGPDDGRLPESDHWLERFYAGGRYAREKKPGVFDHLRSSGAWFVSVDGGPHEPLSVLDAMSQTATVCGGFNEHEVVEAYLRGRFGTTPLAARDHSLPVVGDSDGPTPDPVASRFADALREAVPGLPHVSFLSSGAEANEKALALCRLQRPEATRVLAFEGSFHGRTVLTLHATWNPKKRADFELAGYEVDFAPWPLWKTPMQPEPPTPEGYLETIADRRFDEAVRAFAATGQKRADRLLEREIDALRTVDESLQAGEHFAVILEPMQSEGGDRYATSRFHRALRVLTRRHDVPLIYDEVQCGFGLGGPFAWHQSFGLVDTDGRPDGPDCVVFAKRAQLGVCMSRFEDPAPGPGERASMVRGLVHLEMMRDGDDAARVEALVKPRLEAVAAAFPKLVSNIRCRGFALAFDVPTPEHRSAYIAQRFWRGAVVFAAGTHTIRYRLSNAWEKREVNLLFRTIRQSLAWLEAHPGKQPPRWESLPHHGGRSARATTLAPGYRLRVVYVADDGEASQPNDAVPITTDQRDALLDTIMDLEARTYEPARRDPREKLIKAFGPDGIAIVAEYRDPDAGEDSKWEHVGSALGCPLERVSSALDGPGTEFMRGRENALYSLALTVDPKHHGRGVGRALKTRQLEVAQALTRSDGLPRYRYVTGRNKIGRTPAMTRLNRHLGAHTVEIYEDQYGEKGVKALYYRIPLHPLVPVDALPGPRSDDAAADEDGPDGADARNATSQDSSPTEGRAAEDSGSKATGGEEHDETGSSAPDDATATLDGPVFTAPTGDMRDGIVRPFARVPENLRSAEREGRLAGPTINKITICNYISPAIVRAVEYVTALVPQLPHLYLTSSRDETFDKSLRVLKLRRPDATVAIGLEGGYVGHQTAATRSLSDPTVHVQGPAHFAWPRVPHPAHDDSAATLQAIREAIDDAGGPDQVLGIWLELVQERTGHVIPADFWEGLAALRDDTGVPFVLVETASGAYRSGLGPFVLDSLPVVPDMMTWWGGGQTGFVHVAPKWFESKPLTFVSTWDGDELTLVRLHHQLRALRRLDLAPAVAALDAVCTAAGEEGLEAWGLGLHRVFAPGPERADEFERAMHDAGVWLQRVPGDRFVCSPALDVAEEAVGLLESAIDGWLDGE